MKGSFGRNFESIPATEKWEVVFCSSRWAAILFLKNRAKNHIETLRQINYARAREFRTLIDEGFIQSLL